jgi:hypothetical protein
MLLLYLDHHVPAAVAAGLRARGVDVLACQEDGTPTLDDDLLLDRATSLGRELYTQDEDLLAIAQQRQVACTDFSGVAYAHQLGISIGQAVRDLELLARVYEPDDMRNRVEYLPYS